MKIHFGSENSESVTPSHLAITLNIVIQFLFLYCKTIAINFALIKLKIFRIFFLVCGLTPLDFAHFNVRLLLLLLLSYPTTIQFEQTKNEYKKKWNKMKADWKRLEDSEPYFVTDFPRIKLESDPSS